LLRSRQHTREIRPVEWSQLACLRVQPVKWIRSDAASAMQGERKSLRNPIQQIERRLLRKICRLREISIYGKSWCVLKAPAQPSQILCKLESWLEIVLQIAALVCVDVKRVVVKR